MRSLDREGENRHSASYSELVDRLIVTSSKRHTISFTRPQIFISGDVANSDNSTHPISPSPIDYVNGNSTNQAELSADLEKVKSYLQECKNEINEFQAKVNLFETEFHVEVENLNLLIKEDEDRYTKICYMIHNVTDLHQTQLQYLQNLIQNMEEDKDRKRDQYTINLIKEKLNLLETRIMKL